MNREKESPITDTWCCALLDTTLPCGRKLPTREAFQDCLGHSWCAEHQGRGRLINWAREKNWPDVRFGRYALGPEEEGWNRQMVYGKEALIRAALVALSLVQGQEEGVA